MPHLRLELSFLDIQNSDVHHTNCLRGKAYVLFFCCCNMDKHKLGSFKQLAFIVSQFFSQVCEHDFTGYSAQGFKRL